MSTISSDIENLRELYRELILDHARNPRNFERMSDATHSAEGINPLCGDKLKLYFRINDAQVIETAQLEGSGCAISTASASMLTEFVQGLDTHTALQYFTVLQQRLNNPDSPVDNADLDLGKLRAFEGVREFPSRIKCATLAWHALRSAVQCNNQPASTE